MLVTWEGSFLSATLSSPPLSSSSGLFRNASGLLVLTSVLGGTSLANREREHYFREFSQLCEV